MTEMKQTIAMCEYCQKSIYRGEIHACNESDLEIIHEPLKLVHVVGSYSPLEIMDANNNIIGWLTISGDYKDTQRKKICEILVKMANGVTMTDDDYWKLRKIDL